MNLSRSAEIHARNRQYIPGGVVSTNRAAKPEIVFVRGKGSRVWDADGNEYIDYHAAFAPFVLGHNDPDVNAAVKRVLEDGTTLMGSGTTELEGRLAELIVKAVPSVKALQITNTGSEATFHAIRLSRAHTGRDDVIVMQGGYNGWHNDVACNVMTPVEAMGSRVSPGEYKYIGISAGIPDAHKRLVHVVNYNDLDSVEYVCRRHMIAAMILEPILQNVGIVKPREGYLQGLRKLADKYGFVLIFDEVKTGFRHALGGYQSICGVMPDLCVFGKAIANGYPLGCIGGRKDLLDYFVHPDPAKRVLIAGTYNAFPVNTAAAVATIEKLMANDGAVYKHIYKLGERMETGLKQIFKDRGITTAISRQGSAFVVYFMEKEPCDWHDIVLGHDMKRDTEYRTALIYRGIYHFPMPTKQGSISFAHTEKDIDVTLEKTRDVVKAL
ncbi:MAG: aspartate aminotransferase family protein [Verrucomicrobiae bacterium]|nr:aspartate aminotransferase family protein [Verrucomicrobiae bacterium]